VTGSLDGFIIDFITPTQPPPSKGGVFKDFGGYRTAFSGVFFAPNGRLFMDFNRMITGGFVMKFLRINMATGEVKTEDAPREYTGLGGRGLTSSLINAEVPGACDPLGPDNKLVFAPGILSGTSLVNTSRLSVGAKSPLTGGIKESNAGGTIATALGRLGITAIVVEGCAPHGEWRLLRID
jgi:hypothetical protein